MPTEKRIDLTPNQNGLERRAHVYRNIRRRGFPLTAAIDIYAENGDSYSLNGITKSDAKAIIEALSEVLDLPDESAMLADALQKQADNTQARFESLVSLTVANVMFENGLRRAVMTPSRIVGGAVPRVRVISDKPDLLEYELLEDPLNEPANA